MASYSNSICLAFIRDKYDNIFVTHLTSLQPGQMSHQVCITFDLEPNVVKSIISSSVSVFVPHLECDVGWTNKCVSNVAFGYDIHSCTTINLHFDPL